MKTYLKSTLRKVLPERLFARILSIRSRNYQVTSLRRQGAHVLVRKLVDHYGTAVLHGPFRGMVYPEASLLNRWSTPRLLGSYEQELHHFFTDPDCAYEGFIDIGAAEGYYAVGMARKLDRVVAYETDPREASLCRKMAELNGTAKKIDFRSWCREQELVRLCANRRWLVLSDCEGYEFELFQDCAVNALLHCDVLIELHNRPNVDMLEVLWSRFASSHDLEVLRVEARSVADYPEAMILKEDAQRALEDLRDSSQQWLCCRAR